LGSRARVAVDTSGGPLVALGADLGRALPDLLKPNAEELAHLTGFPVLTPEDASSAAQVLIERGAGGVLATLGKDGAVLVDAAGAWHASPPPTSVVSTVGAGDSSLFGYILGDLRGYGPDDRVRLAVAYGSAAAGLPGSGVPRPEEVHPELVDVRRIG
jgi:1-phosphofructokinase